MGRFVVAAIVCVWVVPVSIFVNRIVPDPYMDEIFHVPQARKYCNGDFRSWDPMITTPPGLYYLSLAYIASLLPGVSVLGVAASSFSDVCSTSILRSTNGVLAVICSMLVYEILRHLRPTLGERKATLHAVNLALYPLHWFFTFLYYTDVASLTVVLAMYLACLKKNYKFSALFGVLAVVIRQTNIIWMLFVACSGIIDITLPCLKDNVKVDGFDLSVSKAGELNPNKSIKKGSNLRKRKSSNATTGVNHSIPIRRASLHKSSLVEEISTTLLTMWHMKWNILVSFSPFFIVLLAFVAFVRWNGSVVLGAKDAHAVSPHFAQVMYFSLVSALAMAPMHFSFRQAADIFWKKRPFSFFQWTVALTAGFLSVHFFSIAHPYLLADNRHYPFYLWRKVIKAHWAMKYLLVPVYTYSWISIFTILGKTQRKIWVLAFFLATAASLVPTPLIEFRYYTVPFYLLMLHSNISDNLSLFLVGTIYVVLNIFTMSMFLFRPFHWDHEIGIQRFICLILWQIYCTKNLLCITFGLSGAILIMSTFFLSIQQEIEGKNTEKRVKIVQTNFTAQLNLPKASKYSKLLSLYSAIESSEDQIEGKKSQNQVNKFHSATESSERHFRLKIVLSQVEMKKEGLNLSNNVLVGEELI